MENELSDLIEELEQFEEEIISSFCVEMGDDLNCCRFCGGDDCIVVRAIDALKRLNGERKVND